MKLTRNLKKHLLPVCLVLAFALLLGLTLNLYKPLKQLTQKKVVNPNNILMRDEIEWVQNATVNGITFSQNEDGSWHVYGTSTQSFGIDLTFTPFQLEEGKTYMLSSGMKHDGMKTYRLFLNDTVSGMHYMGDLKPHSSNIASNNTFGAFTSSASAKYQVTFFVAYAGAVIDEVLCPCLVEGAELGDFYIYK